MGLPLVLYIDVQKYYTYSTSQTALKNKLKFVDTLRKLCYSIAIALISKLKMILTKILNVALIDNIIIFEILANVNIFLRKEVEFCIKSMLS